MKQNKESKKLAKLYKDLRVDYDVNRTFTQQELADALGIKKTQISDLERGKKGITINELKKYSKFFNVTTEYLLGLSDNKHHYTFNIGATLGLSDKAIQRLHYYHTDEFRKDYNYMQVINFLIENLDSPKMERIDRFLFAKPTHFMIKDWDNDEHVNNKYLSICSGLGDYQFTLDEVNSILDLDIEKLLSELKEKAKDFKRKRIVKEIDTTELNEWASKKIGESENGEHSSTQE